MFFWLFGVSRAWSLVAYSLQTTWLVDDLIPFGSFVTGSATESAEMDKSQVTAVEVYNYVPLCPLCSLSQLGRN